MNFKLFIGFIAIFYSNVNAQVDTIYPSTTHQSDLGVFSISRRSYHYTDLTSGSNYNAFINQKRVSDNGIKSCREIKYEIRGKHRTIDYPIYVYHYDTLGYCYLRDKIDENGNIHKSHWEDTAGLHLDPLWRDSMEWIVTNYVGKRFDDLDKVYWSGYGTLMANQDKRFRLVSSKMVDSIKLVNTYRGKGSSAEDSLIYTYNTNGILVEINAFSKNGFSLYTRRRFKIENGFATEFEEKSRHITTVQRVEYDSVGYRIKEYYYYKNPSKGFLKKRYKRLCEKGGLQKIWVYDSSNNLITESTSYRKKVLRKTANQFDENGNQLSSTYIYRKKIENVVVYEYEFW